ncbi:heparinase II/III family protein [Brevundimonas sp. 2R-24]|uniref:Heparinase II/III family protein n=1 Tax=Peiella sedimenti TaxID=3061083 RepID=A0ABT8SKM4_9CAUL|nr:heparinase II/III family protein [Caulobacteraceae bacterium XZ-24]
MNLQSLIERVRPGAGGGLPAAAQAPRDGGRSPMRLRWPRVAARLAVRQLAAEVFGAPGYALTLRKPPAEGFAAAPRDPRPADAELGKTLLTGRFLLAGSVMDLGRRADPAGVVTGGVGDPWNRPSPTRRFAVELHRFEWLPHLMLTGERGAREALHLILSWGQAFRRWSPFAWGHETLPRRVFNLACAARRLSAQASAADRQALADLLAIQARHLLRLPDDRAWAAEHVAAAALAGCVLSGQAGDRLLARAMPRLKRALTRSVRADGVHASRSPEAGLELLLDLLTLDDALLQRGLGSPPEILAAIDRLGLAVNALTLNDGRLACFQGGEPSTRARVAAVGVREEPAADVAPETKPNALGGYQRLSGQLLELLVDVEAPAIPAFADTACAQPLAIEVVCGRDRLITNAGWSERAADRQGLRLAAAASTLTLGEASFLEPLAGWSARVLGPRLEGRPPRAACARQDGDGAHWIEASHDGWVGQFGLTHTRRLYLDVRLDELRGEDVLAPPGEPAPSAAPFAVRFHLHPGVSASLSRDRKSVLLRGATGRGWWFRTDAKDVAIEPSAHLERGLTRRTLQIVLRGAARPDGETRVRWKLSPAGGGAEA